MENKKLKKANPVLLDYNFVAKTSHQIRTSTAIIKESVGLLLDEIPGNLTPEQRKILNICKSNVDRLVNEMNKVSNQLYRKAKVYERIEGK